MALVYTDIAAFENSVRDLIKKCFTVTTGGYRAPQKKSQKSTEAKMQAEERVRASAKRKRPAKLYNTR